MRQEKEQTINGIKFKVTQLGFADGMELLTTLGRIVGPAISDPKKLTNSAAMIGDIIGRLSYTEFASITDKLAKKPVLNESQAGGLCFSLKSIWWAIIAKFIKVFGIRITMAKTISCLIT